MEEWNYEIFIYVEIDLPELKGGTRFVESGKVYDQFSS